MSVCELHLLSAGAAQGLVTRLQPAFEAEHHAVLRARFGAVGAMQELLLQGEPCDVMISTEAMLRQLAAGGRMNGASLVAIGSVHTAVAVPAGQPLPALGDAVALRTALLGCEALYVPDTQRSTAGQHVLRVLQRLDVLDALRPRLAEHPNGATAMRALAASGQGRALGITQVSEILATPGITLVAKPPAGFELATVYSAAIGTGAREAALAAAFIAALASPRAAAVRSQCGIEA